MADEYTNPTDVSPRIEAAARRYDAAAHAVQSGIALKLELDPKNFGTPKDLRVGVDSSMSSHAGLVSLLMEKGVFTHEEYVEAMADAMEREQAMWENILTRETGVQVHLA